jgi:hypothetical protein
MGRNKKVKKETKEQVEKEAKRVAYFDYHLYQKETNYKCMVIDGK